MKQDKATHTHSKHHHREWFSHRHYNRKSRFLWMRFFGFFIFFALPLLFIGGALGVYLRTEFFDIPRHTHSPVGLLFCGLPILVIGLLIYLGTRAFRRMGTPLANVMSAADAVAEGDLSVWVPERGPGEIRRLAESFNRMVEALARAESQRRNMTADVAHELRTPLHILRGNLEGLLDGVYEATPEQIEAMLDETRLLARLIDDLQTISLAEAGQLPLHLAEMDLRDALTDVHTSFSGQAEALGVHFELSLPDEPLLIDADAERLDQVFGNLVGNALRHTPKDGVVFLEAEASEMGVRLQVRDQGEGIPPEDLPFIFDRFYRADKSRSRKRGGSGLGLAIARELIQLHGGHIDVESKVGEGTSFTIILPH